MHLMLVKCLPWLLCLSLALTAYPSHFHHVNRKWLFKQVACLCFTHLAVHFVMWQQPAAVHIYDWWSWPDYWLNWQQNYSFFHSLLKEHHFKKSLTMQYQMLWGQNTVTEKMFLLVFNNNQDKCQNTTFFIFKGWFLLLSEAWTDHIINCGFKWQKQRAQRFTHPVNIQWSYKLEQWLPDNRSHKINT